MADYCGNGDESNSLLTTQPVLDFLGFWSMVQCKKYSHQSWLINHYTGNNNLWLHEITTISVNKPKAETNCLPWKQWFHKVLQQRASTATSCQEVQPSVHMQTWNDVGGLFPQLFLLAKCKNENRKERMLQKTYLERILCYLINLSWL